MNNIKNKENLAEIISLLSDEELLSESAIPELIFVIANFLMLIKDKAKYEEKVFYYHIEYCMVHLYNYLKQNVKYNSYSDNIKNYIEKPISESVIKIMEELLNFIVNTEFPNFHDNKTVIINR